MAGLRGAKTGQVLSSEIVLAFSLFMFALLVFLLAWGLISNSYAQENYDRQMQGALMGISDTAILSPGDPADWEITALQDANSFGLAQSRGVLSPQKLSALQSLNSSHYDTVRERMGAGRFELYIEAQSQGGTVGYRFGKPADLSDSAVYSASVERLALLGGEPTVLKVQLWRNKNR